MTLAFGKRLVIAALLILCTVSIAGFTALLALGHLYYGIYVDVPAAIIALWVLISLAV